MVGFALVVALAAGCGGSSGTGPKTLPPAPSASASPSPPAAPTGTAEQQVLAAVRAYYAAANKATQSGDVSDMRARVVPRCDCSKLADSIEKSYAAGNRFVGAKDSISELRLVTLEPPAATVAVKVRIAAYTLVRPDGSRQAFAAETFTGAVVLLQRAGRWLLASVRGV